MEETPLEAAARVGQILDCLARLKTRAGRCPEICLQLGFVTRLQLLLHCLRQLRPDRSSIAPAVQERAKSLLAMAICCLQSRRPDLAIKPALDLLLLAPHNPSAYMVLGQALESINGVTAAVVLYREILAHQPPHGSDVSFEARQRLTALESHPRFVPPPEHDWLLHELAVPAPA